MYPEKKISFLHEFLVILILIVIVKCGTKLCPVSLALLLTLLVHGIRKLLRRVRNRRKTRRQRDTHEKEMPEKPAVIPPTPIMEQDVMTMAFGLLQRRITEQITSVYPGAKWIWDRPGARERFAAGETLTIQLNCAAGYQTAEVQVSNLQFCGLRFQPAASKPKEEEPAEEPSETEEESVDYGLLAFEWVEANLQRLNSQVSDAKEKNHIGYRIPAEELPHGDSWQAICNVLTENGVDSAEPVADGILIQFKKETETA